ncbi:MAG: membrane protein [Gemmatimonadota bacterium]|nr:MAG: membrane protein [Gemmatimonadota bacterium]
MCRKTSEGPFDDREDTVSAPNRAIDLSGEQITLGPVGDRVTRIAGAIGVLGLVATALLGMQGGVEGQARAMNSYLVAFCFFLSIMLGALFFTLIQHVTRAGWSVVLRRFAEAIAANAPLMAVLALPILVPIALGRDLLYVWTSSEALAHDHLMAGKVGFLNPTFFLIRMVVYFGAWSLMGSWFFRKSVEQDTSGDPNLTVKMQSASAPGLFVFAITLTFASLDLLMSLEPNWFSTMFGVYFFAGSALAFFATLPIVSYFTQKAGRLVGLISREHYHDMGKFVFAFIVFWAYIAFSQYMLYWYANIPEETVWFLRRQTGQWESLSWLLLFGHFIVPFLALISRIPKRAKGTLIVGAFWMLLMHYADLYYVAMPHLSEGVIPLSLMDLTAMLGVGGFFVASVATRLRNRSLVPQRDPRLHESLAFENF